MRRDRGNMAACFESSFPMWRTARGNESPTNDSNLRRKQSSHELTKSELRELLPLHDVASHHRRYGSFRVGMFMKHARAFFVSSGNKRILKKEQNDFHKKGFRSDRSSFSCEACGSVANETRSRSGRLREQQRQKKRNTGRGGQQLQRL